MDKGFLKIQVAGKNQNWFSHTVTEGPEQV